MHSRIVVSSSPSRASSLHRASCHRLQRYQHPLRWPMRDAACPPPPPSPAPAANLGSTPQYTEYCTGLLTNRRPVHEFTGEPTPCRRSCTMFTTSTLHHYVAMLHIHVTRDHAHGLTVTLRGPCRSLHNGGLPTFLSSDLLGYTCRMGPLGGLIFGAHNLARRLLRPLVIPASGIHTRSGHGGSVASAGTGAWIAQAKKAMVKLTAIDGHRTAIDVH